MSVTGKQIAETTLEAYRRECGYIWGTSGETWTQEKQDALTRKYNSDPNRYADYKGSVQYGKKWIGHKVYDCSGLTMRAAKDHGISYHHGSNSMWNYDSAYKGELVKGMSLPVGAYVYTGTSDKKPHIGTYTGDGLVTEAAGSNAGVIQTKLHGGKWKYWSLGKGIEYDFIPGKGTEPVIVTPTQPAQQTEKRPTLRKGNKNIYVKQVQEKLLALGYSLGICGVDGDFGNATEAAVKKFQKDHGLTVDGVVGAKTYAALDAAQPGEKQEEKKYTVTARHLNKAQAEEVIKKYGGEMTEE